MKLESANLLLTGATGGIGRRVANRLAGAGAGLFLAGRREGPLRNLAAEFSAKGARAEGLAGDLTDDTYRRALVERAGAFGVNGVIHGAGINTPGLFEHRSGDELRAMMDINVLAPMLLTRDLLSLLRGQPESLVLFIGSGFGALAYPGFAGYSATKFAIRGFAEALRREMADSPVRVALLVPRAVDTALNDAAVRRLQARFSMKVDSPDRVARAALALVRRPRAELHLGWPDRLFFGINRVRPSLIDRALRRSLPEIRRLLGGTSNP